MRKINRDNIILYRNNIGKVKSFLGRREAPFWSSIVKLVQKFVLLGQVSDVTTATCNCFVRFLGRRDHWALFF